MSVTSTSSSAPIVLAREESNELENSSIGGNLDLRRGALECVSMAQGAAGAIVGRVVDDASGAPLPGANVMVEGAVVSTATDRDGNFRLSPVAAGHMTLVVTYVGRDDVKMPVDVTSGATAQSAVRVPAVKRYEESVTVSAPLFEDAQARALNQQKTAPNITNVVSSDQIGAFPDPNAAEALQSIPGVSIQRDQGEGRYVIIRGTEPRLNATLIDGERIPAPEADVRQVALDVIPADLLQAVELSKALTPDMDADAIGGRVNLVMKQAPDKLKIFGSVGGDYNRSLDSYGQRDFNVTAGQRFADNRVGAIFSISSSGTERGNEDFEPVYTSGNLTDLDLRHYVVTRRRTGATGALDFRPSPGSQYTVRLQLLHRRSRGAPAAARAGRQPPPRARAARSHALGAHLVDVSERPAPARSRDAGLPDLRRARRSEGSVDDRDHVPSGQRDLRAERHANVHRPGQRSGESSERKPDLVHVQPAGSRHELRRRARHRRVRRSSLQRVE
jgi:hypothetical protein